MTTAPVIVEIVPVPSQSTKECQETKCETSLGMKGMKLYKKRTILRGTALQQQQGLPTCTEKCIMKFTRLFYSKHWSTCRC